jgi:putative DNA methylase
VKKTAETAKQNPIEIVEGSLRDTPSLIEVALPVQKISAESYKEQMAVGGKTLTGLGSYWKGRKPLILNRACVLASLMPATDDPTRDLEIFETLMAMDDISLAKRTKRRPKPKELLAATDVVIADWFNSTPAGILPVTGPVDWTDNRYEKVKVSWRDDVTDLQRLALEARLLQDSPYRDRVSKSLRPEEVPNIDSHVWDEVNAHLGTTASTIHELVNQLGVMRFGRRPKVADTFSGSGQIPFEAARLGCDVYASDLNPVACMLTWGAFNIVGGTDEDRETFRARQAATVKHVSDQVRALGIESDGNGWTAKAYLYCLETRCPSSGWMVPMLPSLVVSSKSNVVAKLVPVPEEKRYDLAVMSNASVADLAAAKIGTLRSEGRGKETFLVHSVDGVEHRTSIPTIRGDWHKDDGTSGSKLRKWDKEDFIPHTDDIFQERLYAIQWSKKRDDAHGYDYEFRAVTSDDLQREQIVINYVKGKLGDWQARGIIPATRIERGSETDRPERERGWTHWQHLFAPRQLLVAAMVREHDNSAAASVMFGQALNRFSKLSRWNSSSENVEDVFYNQALNTFYNYGVRSSARFLEHMTSTTKHFPLGVEHKVEALPVDQVRVQNDIYITDPPYGDAVKYEEIYEFFISWMRKNPSPEFADWVWDSRRALAIKGEDDDFRRAMVAAYKNMTEHMPDNGLQVIMFTHQSGTIWADMANIVWASGLRVTAAWYIVTETDSALRKGAYVKGTVLLVLRKRLGSERITRDELALEIQEAVESQIETLTGINQDAIGRRRDVNVFEDADLQMAGYAAALRVLTGYSFIDGKDMTREALRLRIAGTTTFVDELIDFAATTANGHMRPTGFDEAVWAKLNGCERFYLKMLDMEARGQSTLDNYQNFSKAFKVPDDVRLRLMASDHANSARLSSATELGSRDMSEGSPLRQSATRAVLYAIMELQGGVETIKVLSHLHHNVDNYFSDSTIRQRVIIVTDYIADRVTGTRHNEAQAARVLAEALKTEKL